MYMVTIGVLLVVTFDGKIEWYEALILVLMYIAYFLIMWTDGLMKWAKKLAAKLTGSKIVLYDPGKLMFLVAVQ
jgi:Ca2+/Na+ antiporter